jgi:hypothetical protein
VLSNTAMVSGDVVSRFFPGVTIKASDGQDSTAVGNPIATRAVNYASEAGAQRVTISVDRYPTAREAAYAYQQAVAGSQIAPGFSLLPAPDLGQEAYAGTSSNGEETHVGLGVVDDELIVAVTIAGFDAGAGNIAKLVALAGQELDLATSVLGGGG